MFIVLGKTGYIGSAFVQYLQEHDIDHVALSRRDVDYTNEKIFKKYLQDGWKNTNHHFWKLQAGGIINCSGYIGKPNVDACELAKAETLIGSSNLPEKIARICGEMNVPFIHISSGCIYGGYDKDFSENDPPNFDFQNGSFYSGSKALAERLIAATNKDSYIFRLRIPFDEHNSPRNYITKMLSYDKLLNAVNSMSHRKDFVTACVELAMSKSPYGIYNLTNPGRVDTKTVIDMIKKHQPDLRESFTFYEDEDTFLGDVTAPRSNCVLDTSKMEAVLGAKKMRPLEAALEESIINYS